MQEMTRISFALGTSAMINTKPQIGDKNWDMDKWTLHKNVHPDTPCFSLPMLLQAEVIITYWFSTFLLNSFCLNY